MAGVGQGATPIPVYEGAGEQGPVQRAETNVAERGAVYIQGAGAGYGAGGGSEAPSKVKAAS